MKQHATTAADLAEVRLSRFLEAQTSVFQNYKYLTEWCKESFAGHNDQASYELAKRIFKDVVAFESAFEDFEVEFWNYIGDIEDTRARVDHRVVELGKADHKEYFFSKIELCVARLSEVIIEVNALGMEWPFLEELERSLDGLYDVSEDLIESDIGDLSSSHIADLLRKIPPQRRAPLEVFATASSIQRKADTRLHTRIHNASVREAATALHEVLSDTYSELERSNCDPRIMKAVGKCLSEIGQTFEQFSPIKFGIYVGIANGFTDIVSDELSTFLARQVISSLMQCDIFLRNFHAWSEYLDEEGKNTVADSLPALTEFRRTAEDPLFDDDVRVALDDLAADKRDFGDRGKIDYSVFQSISNAISEACRQGLRYISSAPRAISALLADTARDGIKTGIGIIAIGWVLRYSSFLFDLSDRHAFFAWLRPVVEFIKSQTGI